MAAEYPYLVLVRSGTSSQDGSASDRCGRLIVAPGENDAHVIRADTLPELAAAIGERLELAETGEDVDLGRSSRAVQQLFSGSCMGEPIPGLYGVGNCMASVSRRAYWAGGRRSA